MSYRKASLPALPLALAGWLVVAAPAAAAGIPVANQPTVTVEAGAIGATTTLGGTVVPFREVSFSAQLPGRVEYLAGVEGDWVKKGNVLVALDDDDLLAKRNQILAGMETAMAGLRNARVQFVRQQYTGQPQGMSGMGMPSMMDEALTRPMENMFKGGSNDVNRRAQLYNQGVQIDQARWQYQQARAQLQELDAHIRDARSIAPFDGVIVRKTVEVGDTVQPGMPLLAFADTVHLQIKVDVPARLMPGIKKGMSIPAKLDVGDTHIETKVAQVFPMADAQRHTVTIKLDLPQNAPGGPGMYAEVVIPDITTPVENLPVIPKSAVRWNGSLPGVYVVTGKDEAELRMVRLGGFVDGNSVSVLSGLKTGERILAAPPNNQTGDSNDSGGGRPQAE
ncbi:MAG: efflux RND transporter periplasmic adaptor subunit [Magnetococcales bacterium]|nr:efflux RND transporter periplasmic adaptor subunit [Magnetococcales bacterium]